MQLDDGDAKGDEGENEENPFDIDAMKEHQPPLQMEENDKEKEITDEDKDKDSTDSDDGGDDDDNNMKEYDGSEEENDENQEENDMNNTEEENVNRNDKKSEEESDKNKETTEDDNYHPSDDKPSEMVAQPAPQTENHEMMSVDQVAANNDNQNENAEAQELSQKVEVDSKGVGQADIEQSKEGHDADVSSKKKLTSGQSKMNRERKRERPGKSNDDRCLGDEESSVNKKLKTIDNLEEKNTNNDENEADSEMYQHVSEDIQNAAQVLDAATKVCISHVIMFIR